MCHVIASTCYAWALPKVGLCRDRFELCVGMLSKERAQAVVAYLLQDCSVPVGRIAAPGAMGETNPAASNETSSGRGENRRVEVKLLVNKGIVASAAN